jgi:hypothetical protein
MIWSVAVMAYRGVMGCEVQVCILHGQEAPGEGRDLWSGLIFSCGTEAFYDLVAVSG